MEKKYRKILFDLADSISLNEETANNYLKEKGIDSSFYISKVLKEIKRKEFMKTAEINLAKHQDLIEKAIHKLKNAIPEAITNFEKAIKQRNPNFQFRNLKEMNEQQLREVLEDVDLIDTIEELDHN